MDFLSEEIEAVIDFDPRTKLFILLVTNIIMINIYVDERRLLLKFIMFAQIFILLLLYKKIKISLIALLVFSGAWYLELFGIADHINGIIGFILALLVTCAVEMCPCFLAGYILLFTTPVSKLMEGFRKLKIPECINLPLAVVFRFIPTVMEEQRLIVKAMNMRGVSLKRGVAPLKLLEYKYVPLMMLTVNIGDELTVAALTKGLSAEGGRSCIHVLKFKLQDYMLLILNSIFILIYIGASVW